MRVIRTGVLFGAATASVLAALRFDQQSHLFRGDVLIATVWWAGYLIIDRLIEDNAR